MAPLFILGGSEMAKKKNDDDVLATMFAKAEKNVETLMGGKKFLNLSEYRKKYGIPGYIEFGLPDLDMLLMHNPERTLYGVPRGRVTEIHGENSSFKTTLCHKLAAETISDGGRVYWLSTETDFDDAYAREHIKAMALNPDDVEDNFRAEPAKTVSEVFALMNGLMEQFNDVAEDLEAQGRSAAKEFPPILFVVDSLAAMLSGTDYERINDKDKGFDEGQQTGAHAGELHRFFKFFLVPMMRMGATLVVTNHYRADLGFGQRKRKPAHDDVIKYYASLRLSVNAWNYSPQSSHPTRKGITHTFGKKVRAQVYKVRGDWVADGETELVYQYNYGWDYYTSVVNMLRKVGIVTEKKNELTVDSDDATLCALNGTYNLKELKQKLDEQPEMVPEYVARAMKLGPVRLEDMR